MNSELDEKKTSNMVEATATLLVVDDDPDILLVMRNILKGSRWKVISTTSADEALAMFGIIKVHAALLDANMPLMNGLELLGELRKSRPNLPVVIMSSTQDESWLFGSMDQNASGFLEKPFNRDFLLQTLELTLKNS